MRPQGKARRRLPPSGSSANPQSSGTTRHPIGTTERLAVVDCPVDISTVTFPLDPAAIVSPLGVNRHSAFRRSVRTGM